MTKHLVLALTALLLLAAPVRAQVPVPWTAQDIGAPALAGSSSLAAGVFSVTGSGADIWGTSDQFQFIWQPLSGNCTIVARVVSVPAANVYTKAGIMIRQDLTAGSPNAMVELTPASGVFTQSRASAGGVTTNATALGVPPTWIRLARVGNIFTASTSPNGTVWTVVGSVPITMLPAAFVGLAVTSHDAALRATATFDNVSVSGALPPPPPPPTVTATAVWNPNPETDIAGYRLLYGMRSGVYTTTLDVGNVVTRTVTLTPGTTYYFTLQAYNTGGLTGPNVTPEVVYLAGGGVPSTPTGVLVIR